MRERRRRARALPAPGHDRQPRMVDGRVRGAARPNPGTTASATATIAIAVAVKAPSAVARTIRDPPALGRISRSTRIATCAR